MQSRQADRSPEVPRNLLALKSMVIAMAGLLAVTALILVGIGISRLSSAGAGQGAGEGAGQGAGFDPARLPLAPGCTLGSVTAEGDRLIIAIGGRDDCRRIVIADMADGRVIGEFLFPPQ